MFQVSVRAKSLKELRSEVGNLYNQLNQKLDGPGPTQTKTEVEAKLAEKENIQNPEPVQEEPKAATLVQQEEAPAPAQSSELDARGFPWDKRIHSAKKTKSKDGTWRYRRKIDQELIDKVEAELKGDDKSALADLSEKLRTQPAPEPVVAPPEPTPQPQATPQPVAPHIDANSPAQTLDSFRRNITGIITRLIGEGKINQEYIAQLNQHFGVAQIWEVFEDVEKSEELYESFVEFKLIERA